MAQVLNAPPGANAHYETTPIRWDFDAEQGFFRPERHDRRRVVMREEEIPLEEAQREHNAQIKSQKEVIAGEMRYLASIKQQPLRRIQRLPVFLNPGDPGYEEASPG